MTTARWAGLALAVGLLAGAGPLVDEKKEPGGDLKALQGTWVPVEGSDEDTWVFDGDRVTSKLNGGEYVSKVTLDPKAKPEPSIDFKVEKAPEGHTGDTALGIYRLDGDSLTICVMMPGSPTRPTKFEPVEGEQFVFKLKRKM